MTDPQWPDGFEFQFEIGRGDETESLSFLTRDGVVSKTEPRQTERALVDVVDVADRSFVVPDANYGLVGVALALSGGADHVTMTETSARAANCCRINAERNGLSNATVELVPWEPDDHRRYDVLVFAPKRYAPTVVNCKRLLRTLTVVSPEGACYVAIPDSVNADPYVDTLEECCTDVRRVETQRECTVYRAVRPAEFDPSDPVEEHEFRATVGEYTCRFLTQPGLFSWQDLDAGTELLLETLSVPDGARVLDLACGYGAVGSFVGARTDCELFASDDDVLASAFARENYLRNGVSPVTVETADCLDGFADQTFDVVVSNPPTHAGKGVTMKLFDGVRNVLDPEGEFWLVYNDVMSYERTLREEFGFDVTIVASRESFSVARGTP
ncbi:class I SAM-dependent methyltransferase (plasmid) [Halorussus salilacus]|uniref:methyltransferase n=1 Tax=Halorussus salilacus TaxID=2953750 RepID=UPI00209E3EF8|nr:methyltransferase [Halorussus salilacus]USZ70162.1 class I SAM-dependent methyltransferase [Halorussus salilacus]